MASFELKYELRNEPCSPQSLCSSELENWRAESEGLRYGSSWELRIFSLADARKKILKNLSR